MNVCENLFPMVLLLLVIEYFLIGMSIMYICQLQMSFNGEFDLMNN